MAGAGFASKPRLLLALLCVVAVGVALLGSSLVGARRSATGAVAVQAALSQVVGAAPHTAERGLGSSSGGSGAAQGAMPPARDAAREAPSPPPPPSMSPHPAVPPPASPPRTPDDVLARVQWTHACLESRMSKMEPGPSAPGDILTSSVELRAHAFELFAKTAPFRRHPTMVWSGYGGPWIENLWIDRFAAPVRRWLPLEEEAALVARHGAAKAAAAFPPVLPRTENGTHVLIQEPYDFELFTPLVPLFVQWEDILVNSGFAAAKVGEMIEWFSKEMRKNVLYVTVTQRFRGSYLDGQVVPTTSYLVKNLLVLSAGGGGHIPLPLLKQPEAPIPQPEDPGELEFVVSFMGTVKHHAMRAEMLRALRETSWYARGKAYIGHDLTSTPHNLTSATLPSPSYKPKVVANVTERDAQGRIMVRGGVLGRQRAREAEAAAAAAAAEEAAARRRPPLAREDEGLPWHTVMERSAVVLAPRGVGPTSFRLYEAIQMGIVPVYVWDRYGWLPYHQGFIMDEELAPSGDYPRIWEEIGFTLFGMTDVHSFVEFDLPDLMTHGHLWRKKKAALAKYRSLFTYEGVLDQIGQWLTDPGLPQRGGILDPSGATPPQGSLLRCVPRPAYVLRKV